MTTNYARGHAAEEQAAAYLKSQGYLIKAVNWKDRRCEIDIIAEKNRTTYFIEVKFRSTSRQGRGFDYITAAKVRQMQFAAELWCHKYKWKGACELAAISIDEDGLTFLDRLDV